jgi:transcriptional regulator with XRE-family HTH domain
LSSQNARKSPAVARDTGPLEKTLARRLRELAEEKGKPLYIVAELAGFSRPAFWAILKRESSPTLNTIQRLAAALEVDPLELLSPQSAPARPAVRYKVRRKRSPRAAAK